VDATGAGYCWGSNQFGGQLGDGQLTDGSTASSSVPQDLYASGALAGKTLTQISGGTGHTCALDRTGAAYCWGDNNLGDVGDNTTTQRDVAVRIRPQRGDRPT
jgi:alpha-tubulin suppressor-like RCC1 family protein